MRIGGRPCKVVGFNRDDQLKTRIECRSMPLENSNMQTMEYFGNRGITLFKSTGHSADLDAAIRPDTAAETLDKMYYSSGSASTVWLVGYLFPGKTSSYEFSVSTTGTAKFYISSDKSSMNKSLLAWNGNSGKVTLEANKE